MKKCKQFLSLIMVITLLLSTSICNVCAKAVIAQNTNVEFLSVVEKAVDFIGSTRNEDYLWRNNDNCDILNSIEFVYNDFDLLSYEKKNC